MVIEYKHLYIILSAYFIYFYENFAIYIYASYIYKLLSLVIVIINTTCKSSLSKNKSNK